MQNPIPPVKKFVKRNERKILVTVVAVTTAVAMIERAALNQHNDFLKEKGLYEEYWTQTEDE